MRRFLVVVLCLSLLAVTPILAKRKADDGEKGEKKDEGPFSASTFTGLSFRSLGPALASGRISDIAVHPEDRGHYYVAVASGGVWKTTNAGTTWTPVFDDQGSYSIGCVTIDPKNPLVVWVGTGENNSQRSVAYGDGIYKSVNGGKSWEKMGLDESEHIGKIVVDPRDSNIAYVAAQGPLWRAGGDRGLFKTMDGGETWDLVLDISEDTGVNDVILDPRNPDVVYASSYQRRRRVWTLINGGPESALYKSTDGGETWNKLKKGLPEGDMGRIGLAMPPGHPDMLYAIVEAEGDQGGVFRSTDAGSTWDKRGDYISQSPQYYNELVPDPKDPDRVYSMDTWMHVTEDGGKTWTKVGEKYKHVDNHALWIDPENTDYLLAGCDGGVYESFDRGATWSFMANLPVTQFYRVTVDNDFPFYNIYGGTQDNATLGGPSRNTSVNGITNQDWFVTVFGDGFKTQVDPENPDIVYSQWQYGGLVRYDRKSGESVDVQPQPGKGEEALRWNWDSALIISPHAHTRLYFAAQRIFRSDDRGDSWVAISPDLTRRIDRNKLEIMGRVWSVDSVAKNTSTSFFGNIVSLSESPLAEGLIYAGTDDGLIQITEDGGETWRKVESFPGVPGMPYVSSVQASPLLENTVYAAFDTHKDGDFKPYILRSDDRGKSWVSVSGDLPERGTVYALALDDVKPDLLFAGTEFAVFFTVDGGKKWIQLEGGVPVIAMRDLDIQRREVDLVLGTFGRGFYVLDDYSPLREITPELLEQEAVLFPTRRAWAFMPSAPLGLRKKSMQGDSFYTAENPPFGATITYYLKEAIETKQKARRKKERETEKEGGSVSYPSWDELRAEAREEKPAILLTVKDSEGNVVHRITGPVGKGIHRVAWNLRYPAPNPARLDDPEPDAPWSRRPHGPMVVPGDYTVELASRVDGRVTPLAGLQSISVVPLGAAQLAAEDKAALLAFQEENARLQRAVLGARRAMDEAESRLALIKRALDDTPGADPNLADRARALATRLKDLEIAMSGDAVIRSHSEPVPPGIAQRVGRVVRNSWTASSAPTKTHEANYRIAAEEFAEFLPKLRTLIETDLAAIENEMEEAGAPWTPGRVPRWTPE